MAIIRLHSLPRGARIVRRRRPAVTSRRSLSILVTMDKTDLNSMYIDALEEKLREAGIHVEPMFLEVRAGDSIVGRKIGIVCRCADCRQKALNGSDWLRGATS